MRTTESITEDPFHLFQLPVLEKLRKIRWLDAMNFAMGPTLVSVEPGFQFSAELYHTGKFDGTLQVGGKTHAIMMPELYFDSDTGLKSYVRANFKDTELYPPLWIM